MQIFLGSAFFVSQSKKTYSGMYHKFCQSSNYGNWSIWCLDPTLHTPKTYFYISIHTVITSQLRAKLPCTFSQVPAQQQRSTNAAAHDVTSKQTISNDVSDLCHIPTEAMVMSLWGIAGDGRINAKHSKLWTMGEFLQYKIICNRPKGCWKVR